MRKFWFENEYGERISLQSDALFLYLPAGLGFAENREYGQADYGFHEVTDEVFSPAQVSGTLVFKKEPYAAYRKTADWLACAEGLRLVYVPYGRDEYYMDVQVDVLDKSELTGTGWLEAPIKMTGLTPWYARLPLAFTFTEAPENDYKRYPFGYAYQYTVSGKPGEIDIGALDGHFDGGVGLYAAGPLVSPVLTLKNTETGEVYGKLDLSGVTIEEGEQLVYSSRVRGAGVWRQKEGKKTDLVDKAELYAGIPVYMRAPVGVPLTAVLDVENTIGTRSTLYIDKYWKTR